jgi:hypothetical protein
LLAGSSILLFPFFQNTYIHTYTKSGFCYRCCCCALFLFFLLPFYLFLLESVCLSIIILYYSLGVLFVSRKTDLLTIKQKKVFEILYYG